MDRFYNELSLVIHFVVPGIIYLIVWACGGSLLLTALIHASVIIGRAIQFHATVYGINVLGHLKTPVWADHLMALLTGGEAFPTTTGRAPKCAAPSAQGRVEPHRRL